MNEFSPASSVPNTAETGAASSSTASGPRHPVRPAAKPALGVLFLLLGVIMPFGTLGYEWMTHACAAEFLDPIPTWWHVLLVAAVPVSNLLIWLKLRSPGAYPAAWLQHLAAASIAISGIYMLLFLPLAPLGAIATLFLGFGLLPLTPLIAFFAAIRANSKLSATMRGGAPLGPGFLLGLAALALPFGWDWATHSLLIRAAGQPEPQSTTAVAWLRRIGHEQTLHAACYRQPRWGWGLLFSSYEAKSVQLEAKQAVFYRVTGEPYNARPVPALARASRLGGMPRWNFDSHLGGERVADKVAGLTLESSRLDGKVDAVALTSYTEWTFVFKNIAGNASEARAQIELPPGGVVSRLTLWIDGEPREAAFGGRSQVRAAYREVAVVQRRDPVLVTTCGPDRVLMQCFPVPANGGEMKVRVGITAPLRLLDARTAAADWPRMIETNFESSGGLRHTAWIDASAPLSDGKNTVRRDLDDSALAAEPPLRLALSDAAGTSLVPDSSDPAFLIRQTVEAAAVVRPRTVAWVIDGSRAMREHWRGIVASASQAAPDAVFFAGDSLEEWTPNLGPLDRWLRAQDCTGGRDNVPALNAAWDRVSAEAGGAILWIHGPQPVQLTSIESLIQRFERDANRPELFELTVATGPNRIAEKLDALATWQRARDGATPAERLARLLDVWAGRAPSFIVKRERIPRAELSIPAEKSDGHLARLWGREEIERLRATPARLDAAIKLALQLHLVTPVSGAVVLERKEQYDRHGLTPADPNAVPMVPEPATTGLFALAAAWFLSRRARRREG